MPTPFDDPVLRDWFFEDDDYDWFDQVVSTVGFGPFDENDFDNFLRDHNIRPYGIGRDTEILFVDREGWNEQEIHWLLQLPRKHQLKIYTQEIFLCICHTGTELAVNSELASRFYEGHPIYKFTSSLGFRWPGTGTEEYAPVQHIVSSGVPPTGLLSLMGYSVGAKGPTQAARRAILDKTFRNLIPSHLKVENLEEWGTPNL